METVGVIQGATAAVLHLDDSIRSSLGGTNEIKHLLHAPRRRREIVRKVDRHFLSLCADGTAIAASSQCARRNIRVKEMDIFVPESGAPGVGDLRDRLLLLKRGTKDGAPLSESGDEPHRIASVVAVGRGGGVVVGGCGGVVVASWWRGGALVASWWRGGGRGEWWRRGGVVALVACGGVGGVGGVVVALV